MEDSGPSGTAASRKKTDGRPIAKTRKSFHPPRRAIVLIRNFSGQIPPNLLQSLQAARRGKTPRRLVTRRPGAKIRTRPKSVHELSKLDFNAAAKTRSPTAPGTDQEPSK